MQPPDGPPICTALNFLPSRMPPPMSIDDLVDGHAHGDFHQAAARRSCRPGRRPWSPCCSPCPWRRRPRRRSWMIQGTLAKVSTLLMLVGLPQSPVRAGKGGRKRGMPRLPSMEAIRAVSSPQTKAPAPSLILIFEVRICEPRMFLPRNPFSVACLMAMAQAPDGQRILGADVDVGLVGADGVGADHHAFQHRVRVAFQDASGP